jgi:hypothetical protein
VYRHSVLFDAQTSWKALGWVKMSEISSSDVDDGPALCMHMQPQISTPSMTPSSKSNHSERFEGGSAPDSAFSPSPSAAL